MMTRRQLLHKLAAAAASARLAPVALTDAWAEPAKGSSIKLGAQTNAWAIDPARFDSFLGALKQVRTIGYAGFETGFFNLRPQFKSPEAARISIANSGLTFFGIHIFLPPERLDPMTKVPPASLYEEVARGGVALGAQRVIFSGGPAVPESRELPQGSTSEWLVVQTEDFYLKVRSSADAAQFIRALPLAQKVFDCSRQRCSQNGRIDFHIFGEQDIGERCAGFLVVRQRR